LKNSIENPKKGQTMNKDQVKGKVKDIAGRVERQVGEWTGDTDAQVHGTGKQVEGKVQEAWGDVKEAGKKAADRSEDERKEDAALEEERKMRQRKAS
jgi:uncharacterized protein YjbJ (UPF0337 family)